MSDLRDPLKPVGQGACPVCGYPSIICTLMDVTKISYDVDGKPSQSSTATRMQYKCTHCNILFDENDFFVREDGSIKFTTEAEHIYECYRMKKLLEDREIKHSKHRPKDNPFVDEESSGEKKV